MARWRKKVIKMDEDYKSVRKEIDKTLGKTGERKTDREQEFIVKEPAVKKIADEEGPVKKEVFNLTTSYSQTWLVATITVEKSLLTKKDDKYDVCQLVEPLTSSDFQIETRPKITLKVIDMESGTTRVCNLDEAKTWDWNTLETLRIIGGRQITSWDRLVELLSVKAQTGCQGVEIYEAPLFMVLGGG